MEHKLQFSSTACENGTFVKKQTSQFLVALTVGIRKDIDGCASKCLKNGKISEEGRLG